MLTGPPPKFHATRDNLLLERQDQQQDHSGVTGATQ
jgi:hypothetical protein